MAEVAGVVDLDIVNEERNNVKTIKSKHVLLGRKILVGGHTDKVKLRFKTEYDTGVSINAINIEGQMKVRSRNI
jgi:calcineurin-like phosphoesterase family protein